MDGITRWGSVKYITLPSIMPTIVLLFILGIGNFLNLGYEQNLLLGQATTRDYWEIIDTYVLFTKKHPVTGSFADDGVLFAILSSYGKRDWDELSQMIH